MGAETVLEAYYGLVNAIREKKQLSYSEMKEYLSKKGIEKPSQKKGFLSFLRLKDSLDNLFNRYLRNADEFDLKNLKATYKLAKKEGINLAMIFPETFEEEVTSQKTQKTEDGTLVQTNGEKIIADFLYEHGIDYVYDESKFFHTSRSINGKKEHRLRPDFFLPKFNIYIEYWGWEAIYGEHMNYKIAVYNESGNRLISIRNKHEKYFISHLKNELNKYGVLLKSKNKIKSNKCKNCGIVIDSSYTYCYHCHTNGCTARDNTLKKKCKTCGKPIDDEYTYCYECNQKKYD